MHDGSDDDGFDNDEPLGRLIQSGIRPDAGRADYALPEGVPALQDESLEWDDVDREIEVSIEESTLNRRVLLCALGALGVVGGAGFFIGTRWGTSEGSEKQTARPVGAFGSASGPALEFQLAGARALARGPLDQLTSKWIGYMAMVQIHGGDEDLWRGVERLAMVAIRGEFKDSRKLAIRILDTAEMYQVPDHLQPLIAELARRVPRFGGQRRR